MNEIEQAVRALVRLVGTKRTDKSRHIIVDADGTFVYEWVSRRVLADEELARLQLDLLLKRREDERAKAFGTGDR